MSKISENATVSLFVNGEQAEAAMDRLRKKAADLDKQLKSAMDAGDKKTANRLQRELDRVNKELNRTESAAKGTGIALNNLSNTSIHGLRNSLKYLQKQLSMTKPDSERWKDYAEKIELVKDRLSELNEELEGGKSLWGHFKSWADDTWPAIDLLSRGYETAVDTLRGYVDAYAEMDQEMANVRKFTGMTEEQVADLNEEFKKMDTRTSREDLNKLAQEAGRLGKTSIEDVLGFVRAADQINVALDDLGDGATLTLSKLTGIFGDEAVYGTEQSLLKVGSVINELSQNCSASAPYLAQFAERMGGVGAQAGMTIPQIMGFAAVLDSNSQAVEASSTALSQVLVRMMQEPAKYAKVAGLDVTEFATKLKEDANGALIMFLETLQKAGGMDVLSPMFKDMGENGSRAIAALSTLATHIDAVKAQQEAANVAFAEGTSIGIEYDVQNNTVQAGLDKCKKAANELRVELGERLAPLMKHMLTSGSAVMRGLLIAIKFIEEHKTEIFTITAAIALYTAAIYANNLALNIHVVRTKLATTWTTLWSAAQAKCSGIIAVFRLGMAAVTNTVQYFTNGLQVNYAMQQRWRTAMAGMKFASWTGLVIALGAAFVLLYNRMKKSREEMMVLSKIRSEAAKKVGEERVQIDLLVKAAENERLSLEERHKAIAKLNSIIPDYNAQLDDTTGKYTANKKALDEYIKSLTRKYELEGAKDKLAELGKEKAEAVLAVDDAKNAVEAEKVRQKAVNQNMAGNRNYATSSGGFAPASVNTSASNSAALLSLNSNLETKEKKLEEIIQKENKILNMYGQALQASEATAENQTEVDTPEVDPPSGSYKSMAEAKKEERERKKREAEARREAAKAKREFKDQLDAYKAQKSSADREVLELYKAGFIDYEELMRRRHKNELKYYDDSLAHFEKTFADQKDTYLQDDKDYQKLLLDKEKSDEKYETTRVALALESINRRKAEEERSAQHMFDVRSDPSLKDEIALQAELFRIHKNALLQKQALYNEGSKEYADTQYEIEQLEQEKELNLKKLYFRVASELRQEYDKKSSTKKFELEKAALDALLKAKILTAEQYTKYLKGLSEKYKQELPDESDKPWTSADETKYDADTRALRDALDAQLLSQAEFNERMAKLDDERRKKMLSGLKATGGEWNAMLVDVYSSFAHLIDGFDGTLEGTLRDISDCVAAVSAIVGAGMQIATEFAKAEADIQIKSIEKRYDREIELAQGNSYKVRKLEEKKEKETAKVKNDASRKQYQMQVIQAIAQSLIAGLNAYSSTQAIPVIGPALAPAAMAVALAMGATQVALLKKQQQAAEAQGYSKGGFTPPGAVDEPAGIVHAGEWVASQRLLASPVARPMIEALDYAQRTNTIGSLRAEDVSRSIRANDSLVRMAEGDSSAALVVAAVARNAEVVDALTRRLNEPFVTVNSVTGDHGIKQAQDNYARLIKNVTPKSKQK